MHFHKHYRTMAENINSMRKTPFITNYIFDNYLENYFKY